MSSPGQLARLRNPREVERANHLVSYVDTLCGGRASVGIPRRALGQGTAQIAPQEFHSSTPVDIRHCLELPVAVRERRQEYAALNRGVVIPAKTATFSPLASLRQMSSESPSPQVAGAS